MCRIVITVSIESIFYFIGLFRYRKSTVVIWVSAVSYRYIAVISFWDIFRVNLTRYWNIAISMATSIYYRLRGMSRAAHTNTVLSKKISCRIIATAMYESQVRTIQLICPNSNHRQPNSLSTNLSLNLILSIKKIHISFI